MMADRTPWLIFCGTTTSLQYALDADGAFEAWNSDRLISVGRDEVNVRALRADDEAWIADSGSTSMLEAVKKLARG